MSEFKEKVEALKQTFSEPGFTVDSTFAPDSAPNPQEESQIDHSQELSQEEPAQEQKDRKSKKKIESFKSRIEQLTYEKNIREAQNQDLMSRLQEQERILAEKQQQLEQNAQYNNAYYENLLETKENSILNELKMAKEEGDVDKEVLLSKELARVQADKSTQNFYKSQLRNQPFNDSSLEDRFYPAPSFPDQQFSPPVETEPENEVYEEWLEKNQWADPRSPNFSPRLRQEIDAVDAEMADLLRYNGDSHLIGTSDYFNALDNIMRDRYGVKGRQQSEQASPSYSQGSSYNVAPVSRSGSSMADQYISNNSNTTRRHIPLSEDEYKIARNLQIRLPNGKYLTGEEAVRRYAEAKRSLPSGSNKVIIG